MADQPFAQEYLSVKLCRLLVHDNFHHGYDFTDAETSPEESLVHDCMLAWENPTNGGPKGQMREVLRVLLKSDLFRNPNTAAAKVKTPLEFAASTLRAFRASNPMDPSLRAPTRPASWPPVDCSTGRAGCASSTGPNPTDTRRTPVVGLVPAPQRALALCAVVGSGWRRPGDGHWRP